MKFIGIYTFIGLILIQSVFAQQKAPVAIDDSVFAYAGSKLYINVLENDYWMEGHKARIYAISVSNTSVTFNDSVIIYSTDYDDIGIKKINYVIEDCDNGLYSGVATLNLIFINNAFGTLSVGNLNASFNARGNHHRLEENNENTDFLVFDDGFQKTLIKNLALWIGGKDKDDQIHVAAETDWSNDGNDFWMGPVSNNYNISYFNNWSTIWKVSRQDIDFHISNWEQPYYKPTDALATWPGGRDYYTRGNQETAPYFDYNTDGRYNPLDGDYPIIKGDEALYFVYNDDALKHASSGRKLGVEIRGMAYVYHKPESDALSNAVFVHYDIINKSDTTYYDTYLGVYSQMSIGEEGDDYIECDVMRNSFFGFNGDSIDGQSASASSFGKSSPAQSVTILGGPFIDGLSARMGMTGFMAYNLDRPQLYSDPPSFEYAYYIAMQGYWSDGSRMEYGGKGHAQAGSVGPYCHYALPGNSDPFHIGTEGEQPNEGYTQNGKYWTEIMEQHAPHEISGMASMGPFTFRPGKKQELDLVFVYGQDTSKAGSVHGIPVMIARIDSIRYYYDNNLLPDYEVPAGTYESDTDIDSESLVVSPNPCSDILRVRCRIPRPRSEQVPDAGYQMLSLYDISGRRIKSLCNKVLQPGIHEFKFDVSELPAGLYIVHLQSGHDLQMKKLVVY